MGNTKDRNTEDGRRKYSASLERPGNGGKDHRMKTRGEREMEKGNYQSNGKE